MTTLLSCSVDEPDTYTEHFLPVETYTIPSDMRLNQSYTITLTYQKPTACYDFNDIYFGKEGLTRTIAVFAYTKDGQECSDALPPVSSVSFVFNPITTGTYNFKFFKGTDKDVDDTDDDGNVDELINVFEEVPVVVTE
ncbi:MAG: hypothetical protein B7Y83_14545 [Flavobacteriales bacterium 32-34-25]|nr:MAG: hypothetical protein B7Y83_14545 [Flavobacteriales bacterium 32-34-25]